MSRKKYTTMMGRKFALPNKRKFGGGEIVTVTTKAGLGKKWIVENSGHEADYWAKAKHSYYRCRRGQWVKYFRSDMLVHA